MGVKGRVIFFMVGWMLLPFLLVACNKQKRPQEPFPSRITSDLPLRELVARTFPGGEVQVGVASHYRLFGTPTMDTVDAEFGYVTPANDFKQTYIHPRPGIWRWDRSDAWIEHALHHRQLLRLHAPIGPQCSKWAKEDDRTAEDLDALLKEYVTALCRRYDGQEPVHWLDVVNETIDTKTAEWFGPKAGTDKWENPWPKIGYDTTTPLAPPLYIEKAFRLAEEHAPHIRLIINQHGALEEAVWEKMKALVGYLRSKGIRVDGIGWQAHIDVGWEKEPGNLDRLAGLVRWCHDRDLEFHITEFNVWLRNGTEGHLEEQAATFTAVMKVLLDQYTNGPVRINFWQVKSSDTQHPDRDGCLFDNDLNPKPAYFAVKNLIKGYTEQ